MKKEPDAYDVFCVTNRLRTTRRAFTVAELRQHAKPIVLHAEKCPHPRTATCLCGKEPFYSPAARRARGEIE